MKRKLILFVCLIMLIPVAVVVAQSSPNFVSHRIVMLSGGSAESDSYTLDSVIGQPVVGRSQSGSYTVTGGLLTPNQQGHTVWLPVIQR